MHRNKKSEHISAFTESLVKLILRTVQNYESCGHDPALGAKFPIPYSAARNDPSS